MSMVDARCRRLTPSEVIFDIIASGIPLVLESRIGLRCLEWWASGCEYLIARSVRYRRSEWGVYRGKTKALPS
jgi:hypothetical protein